MDSLKKLAAAVLIHALLDAQKGCPEAREWLLKDDSSFPFWCRVYGVKPTSSREELCKVIETRTDRKLRKLRRKRITQALTEQPELSNREIGRRLECHYETVSQVRKLMPRA